MKVSQCRLVGGRQKLTDVELEEQLLIWIHKRLAKVPRVSRKTIMFKPKSIYDEK